MHTTASSHTAVPKRKSDDDDSHESSYLIKAKTRRLSNNLMSSQSGNDQQVERRPLRQGGMRTLTVPPSLSPHGSRQESTMRNANGPTILLEDAKLWAQFHSVGNEMIITKGGRCLFPTLRFRPICLDPQALYSIAIDIVQTVPHKFKFKNGHWAPVSLDAGSGGESEDMLVPTCRAILHSSATQSGAFWIQQGISFAKIKLTNRCPSSLRSPSPGSSPDYPSVPEGYFYLNSFHQYQPRVHLIKHSAEGQSVTTYLFEETKFIAVTHYQSEKVNSLKKNYNPHAKGFKDYETKLAALRIRSGSVASTTSSGTPTTTTNDAIDIPTFRISVNERSGRAVVKSLPATVRQSRGVIRTTGNRYQIEEDEDESPYDNGQEDDQVEEDEVECSSTADTSDSDLSDSDDESTYSTTSTTSLSQVSSDAASPSQENQPPQSSNSSSPLQLLALFCSYILDSGNLALNPAEIVTHSETTEVQRFQTLVDAYEIECKRLREVRNMLMSSDRECAPAMRMI
ncbi:uncharacterized protein SPPG_06782 [Spizellomyces punctatus DAOM BR117]|uniref:T-box domain-containing protein n=1 Tax=Spizellomyces punctatus (strain DAOM BR117) TaxID=645134 RepID=A0A0L0H8D6_SPIPD|nr:uncharacterized protein SPPG_06782 [Spizellomyces punctatus DAOM BR117]KNC97785.1 hypothetical protein SPPG_06782 [Spizellomyces punctatus DAOM BR117]|eukprot:XP_016605825.1 hypothetical protein SPPG_06782 [Spizellomyces punctatus DAOM BR117]